MPEATAPAAKRHVVSALVVDRPGTLNRVSGLLRARSFNIESLTVGSTHVPGQSRMTIVIRGDEAHTHQVLAQLNRVIEVLEVDDLTHSPCLELELALVELDTPADAEAEATVRAAMTMAGGELLDVNGRWRLRLAAAPDAVEAALITLRATGLRNLVRAGTVAMATSPAHHEGDPE